MPIVRGMWFSVIWGMEEYYDVTVAKRQAREIMLSKGEHSLRKSLSSDGQELIELPLRYDRYVSICVSIHVCKFVLLHMCICVCTCLSCCLV